MDRLIILLVFIILIGTCLFKIRALDIIIKKSIQAELLIISEISSMKTKADADEFLEKIVSLKIYMKKDTSELARILKDLKKSNRIKKGDELR